jgi:hypothetical protein
MAWPIRGEGNANIPYATDKLHLVKDTNWISTFSGWAGIQSYQNAIEAEIELGHAQPFDPHLPVGGPAYLNALRNRAHDTGQSQNTQVVIAGLDMDGNPYTLSATLPNGGPYCPSAIAAFGVQDSTAVWLMSTLFPSCESLEDVKRLACFAIFQIAKQEIKVGHPEHYRISLAVLENGKQPQRESKTYSEMLKWLDDWERNMRSCFMSVIGPHGNSRSNPIK